MKIKQLKNISSKINFGKPYKTPEPVSPDLPRIYNIMLVCGSKGSGKGVIVNHYLQLAQQSGYRMPNGDKVEQRIIWCSGGTSKSKQNQILDELKYLDEDDRIDLDLDYPDKQLKEIYQSILDERDEIEVYNIYRKTYDKFIKSKSLSNLTLEELTLLEFKNFIDPKDDPDAPRDKDGNLLYHPRMVFLILDDLIGSDGFSSNKRGNFLNRLAVKSRHESEDLVGMNLFFITQSFKSIPAVIRRQTDIFVLLKSASRSQILDAISEEVGSHFHKEELTKYYDQIMKIPYGSLILSIHKKEKDENRVRTGWDNIIEREKKYLL